MAMKGVVEEGRTDGAHVYMFTFRGLAGNNAVSLNEKSVVDDVFDAVVLGYQLGPETFSGAAFSNQREDFRPAYELAESIFNAGTTPGAAVFLYHSDSSS